MSGWTYPYASGVDATGAALNIAVGLPPGDLTPTETAVSAERAFISIPGQILDISGINDASTQKRIMDLFIRVKKGDTVQLPVNNLGKCGNVISKADTREEAARSAGDAVRSITIRLKPDYRATDAFLFNTGQVYQAFRLRNSVNIRAFDKMPAATAQEASDGSSDIVICGLPELNREQEKDWHGMSIGEALQNVLRVTGVELVAGRSPGKFALGRLFWKAFLQGGAQGGIYIIDTVREKIKQHKSILSLSPEGK